MSGRPVKNGAKVGCCSWNKGRKRCGYKAFKKLARTLLGNCQKRSRVARTTLIVPLYGQNPCGDSAMDSCGFASFFCALAHTAANSPETHNMSDTLKDRRRLLVATSGVGLAAAAATAVPLVASLTPSDRARAAGAPVQADVSKLAVGSMMTVEWRGKPVWILRRTPQMLAELDAHEPRLADPASEEPQQPDYAANRHRSIHPEYLVVIGICTHLGCSPSEKFTPGAGQWHRHRLARWLLLPLPRFDL